MNMLYINQFAKGSSFDLPGVSSKVSVLIAEDEPAVQDVLVRMAKRAGLEVVTADNGAEALARFLEAPTPLVLTDLNMPKMDGLQLIRQIKAVCPNTFVVIVTANYDTANLSQEADLILGKPFRLQEFNAAIEAFFRSRAC